MKDLRTAVLWYRVMAYVTGVVLMVLCFAGIPLQVAHHPAVANDVGVAHGILYIIYLVSAWLLARKLRLEIRPTVIMLLAGTIPVLTFIVERWVTRAFINPALASQPDSSACSASLPTRTGGLDQIPANRAGSDASPGVTQRTFGRPAAPAFRAHSSSARSLTSTAQTVAPGERAARTQATGP